MINVRSEALFAFQEYVMLDRDEGDVDVYLYLTRVIFDLAVAGEGLPTRDEVYMLVIQNMLPQKRRRINLNILERLIAKYYPVLPYYINKLRDEFDRLFDMGIVKVKYDTVGFIRGTYTGLTHTDVLLDKTSLQASIKYQNM